MTDKETIRALQEELNAIRQQMGHQIKAINDLQARIDHLAGKREAATAARSTFKWSMENFIGLRLIHVVGIVVLVIGLSIGVKYAIDRELISVGMRITLAYTAGLILYVLSLQLRKKFSDFSAILFGGAMASLYFTTYAAHVKYGIVSFPLAFGVMVSFTVYTTFEAIKYNRQEIALLGLVGAYAIPFLISSNADRADLFFLYISLINTGVIFLVAKKAWRSVGFTAQCITWLLFIGWSAIRYNVNFQQTGVFFMILFFLIFHFAVFSMKLLRRNRLTNVDVYQALINNTAVYLAALFVFGLPLDTGGNLGMITLLFSLFAGLQAVLVYRYWTGESLLMQMLSTISLTLFIFFIAFTWDGFTVTLLWLLTAIALFVIGFRLRSVRTRMAAIVLFGITLGKLLLLDSIVFTTIQKVIAYLVLGILLLVVSFLYQKFRQQLFSDKE